jgi:crotonobetainyl-CoA:carnitine CoA-transferase CaiB-like acyl-CoA transferase
MNDKNNKPGMLAGVRVVEFGDELSAYTGLVLAGLGAEVVKIEQPGGCATRDIGPFLDDIPDREKSLFFWVFNRGKRSIVLDLKSKDDRATARAIIERADVLLDGSNGALHLALGISREKLIEELPRLIQARITPFGDDGPWAKFKGSDLVHLALSGIMMNCGYDPEPDGHYDLPPVAPQIWQAYHIAGEQLAAGIAAALLQRNQTGNGQDLSCAVHHAVSINTELDLMNWVMRRAPLYRQTCRHAAEVPSATPIISYTKDGRWMMAQMLGSRDQANVVPFLRKYNLAADLADSDKAADVGARVVPGSAGTDERQAHMMEVIQRFTRSYSYDNLPWREAQADGLLWAPLRKPHENAQDDHWLTRQSYADVEHPELKRSFRYATSKWLSTATAWQVGRRAPLVGEDSEAIRYELTAPATRNELKSTRVEQVSARGKPFALGKTRILDFSWFLATAGGTRFLAALGVESIKVEWKANPDTRTSAMAPVGGRAARDKATAPLKGVEDTDMGGQFNNKNAGKRGLSLNIRDPRGLDIAKRLVAVSDIVAEGFSPGVLERWGLGYDVMRSIKPDIIYAQQSGMGSMGTYGRFRTVGPVAASFAGISDMSGIAEPAMPAGWGYSFLDWMGAYSFALCILGALYHRDRTGEGQWIDASQCEAGLFIAGVPTLDWSVNGRVWHRYGNRSPYKLAAPHGAYRCRGEDRWIAIACFTDAEWNALLKVAGSQNELRSDRFKTLADRLAHQDELDRAVEAWTRTQDARELMLELQQAGVPAGVCQNAEDRCEHDPQLAALNWMTEVTGTKIGRWPVVELPYKMSRTPTYAGGPIDRGAPCYGEDNIHVLSELLGFSKDDIATLQRDDVI